MVIIDASNAIISKSPTVDDEDGGIDGENGHTITAGSMAATISNGGDAPTLLLNSPPPPTLKDIAHSQYDPSAAQSQDSWGRELASSASLSTDETSTPQFDANGTTAPAVADSLLSVGVPNGDDDDDDDVIDAYVDDDNTKILEVGYGDTAILRSPIIEEDTTIAPINDGRAAYSAQTANAIALILQGQASQINQHEDGGGDNGNNEEKDTTMTSSTTRGGTEISLGDRTAALLSVYSDYVRENINNDDGPPKNPFINDTIEDNVNIHDDDKLCIQMKEELKEVTFDRFMSGLETQSYVDNYEDDDDYYDSDDDAEYENFDNDDMLMMEEDPNLNGTDWSTPAVVTTHNTNSSSNGEMTKKRQRQRRQRRRRIPPPPPPQKRLEYYRIPTAASTIASFRLRADVALSAVTQKVNTVVRVTRGITRTTIGSLEVVDDGQSAVIDDDEDDEDDNDISSQRTDLEYGESSGDAIYGLHILERDMTRKKQSMKRNIGSNDSDINDDDNGLDTFYETCDELGMTPKTHPGLHHFYRHHHHHKNGHGFSSIRYQYPMFRSKRVRRCILYSMTLILFGLICVALVSSISNGFETIRLRNTPPLPEDWRDELDWSVKQKDEWEKNHAQNVNYIGDTQTTMNMTLLYHKISASHRPVWYDRSTGWTGRTWDEAISFCTAHDNNIPCPYEVYCPNEKTLLSGIMDTDGVSWAPIMNAHNEWVQVGSGGTECALYSLFHNGQSPTWGEDGSSSMINTEANTRHIMCCREHPLLVEDSSSVDWVDSSSGTVGDANYGVIRPDGPPAGGDVNYPQSTVQDDIPSVSSSSSSSSDELKELFTQISRKYNPMWFDRESGWMGKTYQESLDFCANVWSGYIPCPYDAYW